MKKVFFLCAALSCGAALNGASISVDNAHRFLSNWSLQQIDSIANTCESVERENKLPVRSSQKKSEKRIAKIFAKADSRAGETIDDDKLSLRALHLGITSTILMLLGFLSVIVLVTGIMFLLFAILSAITGISAISKAKKVLKNKENDPRFRRRATIGLTLGIIGLSFSALPFITRILDYLTSRQ